MPLESRSFDGLGTRCEVFAVDAPAEALDSATRWLETMAGRFTRFDPESELSRFNHLAGTGWVAVGREMEALLRESLRAWEVSGGLVHAGVLASLLAAGYTRPLRKGPTEASLADLKPLPPLPEMLAVEAGRARLAAGSGLDFGGIAKGWLADRLAERLAENCLVNLGGDLFAHGAGPAGEGWPVRFGDVNVLLLEQGAATSSTRVRRWGQGQNLHHLIDPRTGLPAESDLGQVSVLAVSATEAEIHAKTALLLGALDAPAYLAAHTLGWWLD